MRVDKPGCLSSPSLRLFSPLYSRSGLPYKQPFSLLVVLSWLPPWQTREKSPVRGFPRFLPSARSKAACFVHPGKALEG